MERSKLPYVRISAKKAAHTPPWASKYRGAPYWLIDKPFPMDSRGEPLILLVQINFAEVPKLESYPAHGILQLFVSGEESKEHIWGSAIYDRQPFDPKQWFASLQDQRFFRVVYHPEPTSDIAKLRSPPKPGYQYVLPIMEEARLSFDHRTEYVLPEDYRFKNVFGKPAYDFFSTFGHKEEDVANRYIDFAHEWVPAKIGGYASFVQRDPREAATTSDWQLLLEMQSVGTPEEVEVMWGDVGVGGLFIRTVDLANRDFSKVAYYWDNH